MSSYLPTESWLYSVRKFLLLHNTIVSSSINLLILRYLLEEANLVFLSAGLLQCTFWANLLKSRLRKSFLGCENIYTCSIYNIRDHKSCVCACLHLHACLELKHEFYMVIVMLIWKCSICRVTQNVDLISVLLKLPALLNWCQ